ncbi:hypothetical protein J3E71DRAFT_237539 [Bipolaris maydis]|nr:hypothetical protein J3E71DRAFT_237539 [Bipolaris maydis]
MLDAATIDGAASGWGLGGCGPVCVCTVRRWGWRWWLSTSWQRVAWTNRRARGDGQRATGNGQWWQAWDGDIQAAVTPRAGSFHFLACTCTFTALRAPRPARNRRPEDGLERVGLAGAGSCESQAGFDDQGGHSTCMAGCFKHPLAPGTALSSQPSPPSQASDTCAGAVQHRACHPPSTTRPPGAQPWRPLDRLVYRGSAPTLACLH